MTKQRKRRYIKAGEKVGILKRHLVDREEVSLICEELKVPPNQFYEWQKQFFERGAKAFEADEEREEAKLQATVAKLEEKLQRKDSVLSELMEEHVALKRILGNSEVMLGGAGPSRPSSRLCPSLGRAWFLEGSSY